jgi:predicted ATPase
MNLRKARIDDHWRRIFKRKYELSLDEVKFTGDHLFSDFQTKFSNGLTCIVGKNGIGKSTFIRAVYNAFHSEGSNRNLFKIFTLQEGEILLSFKKGEAPKGFATAIGEKVIDEIDEPITSFLFDPCSTIPSLQEMLLGQNNFDELLEGYQEIEYNHDELAVLNYLTGNIYSKVSLIVIEDAFDNFSTFPYFKVASDFVEYDSRNMGLGELSLFYFFWLVNYINKFEGSKFLLVEEPESFLPPFAQEKVANILAHSISEFGISCILSTHSEHILKRVPRSNIVIFRKSSGRLSSRIASDKFEYLQVIGLAAPKVGLLLFEDSAAILFFKTIIKYSKEFVPDSFYYYNSGSEGDIISDLNRLPSKIEEFRIIGVFDGDCRTRDIRLSVKSLYTFLPSVLSPEEIIIAFINATSREDISSYFSLSIDKINDAIDATQGCDHHDYFEILSTQLNIPYDYLFSKLCEKWCEQSENESALGEFITDFSSVIL